MKENDLSKPRFRVNPLLIFTSKNSEEFLKKVKSKHFYTYKQINKLIKSFNEQISKDIIEKREGVELPFQLGKIFVGVMKRKGPNYKLSVELNQKVYHRNWESDNLLAKIVYLPIRNGGFINSELYGFNATREFSRGLSKVFNVNWKRYRFFKTNRKIRPIIERERIFERDRLIEEDILKIYDEFEF